MNSSTKQVSYNPWFWAYKHFGYYVKEGAKVVRYTINGGSPYATAIFKNPNGDIIVVTCNNNASTYALTLKVNNTMYKASLPANSFNTLRIATGTAVQERKPVNAAKSAQSTVRISNSTLYFTLPAAAGAQEMNITLRDLQGRTVWTGHRGGNAILGGQQTFMLRREQGGLLSGTYLLTVRIKNSAGTISTVENKVKAVD